MHKTAAPWEELREKYEAGGYTYMQLAKEYGVSVQTVGRHARKENWVSGCRNERRRRAESRDCLLEMTRALMRGAKRAAEEAEKGEACTKELKELAGILQTLAGLEKELGGGTAVQTVQVLMGEGVRIPATTSSPWALMRYSPNSAFSPVAGSRVKATPVPDFSFRLPNTMGCTLTAVPQE